MTQSKKKISFFHRIKAYMLSVLIYSLVFNNTAFAFSPYSNSELDELEKEFVAEINQSSSVLRDPLSNQYLTRLGQKLATHSEQVPPSFFIVKADEINAFAGPGGHIGINSELFLLSEHESELAAVLAHEIAHVRQHHLYRMLEHQQRMKVPMLASMLAAIALGSVLPGIGSGAMMAALGGFAQDSINFIRSNEKEADRIGIGMLKSAGFDPRGMIHFFQRMRENARYYSANVPAILRTHPMDDDRIAEAQHRTDLLSPKNVPDTLEYQLTKERIRVLTAKHNKKLLDYYANRCPNAETNDNACLYGRALALLGVNQHEAAYKQLESLVAEDHENLYYALAISEAEIKNGKKAEAVARLRALHENYPGNYPVIMALAKALSSANRLEETSTILLQASRLFPTDLPVCYALARAHANNHLKEYAYFTYAQCHLLQGHKKEARRLFTLAKTLIKKDRFLQARIEAKLDEINEEIKAGK